jgi:hypothetical protein
MSSEGAEDQGVDRCSRGAILIGVLAVFVLQIGGMFVLQIGGMICGIMPPIGGIRPQFYSVFSLFRSLNSYPPPEREVNMGDRLVLDPSYADAETFLRNVTFSADELPRFTTAILVGGFRWFQSPNVVPIEKYRRPPARPPA